MKTEQSTPLAPKARPRRPKLSWADPLFCLVFGLLLGVAIFFAGRFAFEFSKRHYPVQMATAAYGHTSPRLLLEAKTETFQFRASGIDLQSGSVVLGAIMQQLPQEVRALEAAFPNPESAPDTIDVTYQRLASAGPVHSLVRIERQRYPDSETKLSYATSVFDSLKPDTSDIRHMFRSYPGVSSRLNNRLCKEVQRQKAIRLGQDTQFDCADIDALNFFDGAPSAFVGSKSINQFGGLRFYFKPGEIGNVDEGMYIVTLPQSTFRDDVKDSYRGLLGGYPATAD